MRRETSRFIAIIAAFFLIGGGWWYFFTDGSPRNRASIIKISRELGRLEPFPDTSILVTADTVGNTFARQFYVTFSAPAEDVRRWLQSSPGTQSLTPERDPSGGLLYIIPCDGDEAAQISVSPDGKSVSIAASDG